MAWNPTKEVCVSRDAAEKLDSPMCVVVWVTRDAKIGMASYGETKKLCGHARRLGNQLYESAVTDTSWF